MSKLKSSGEPVHGSHVFLPLSERDDYYEREEKAWRRYAAFVRRFEGTIALAQSDLQINLHPLRVILGTGLPLMIIAAALCYYLMGS